ncbi:oadg fam: sodium pump decarboxylases gamma subunit [Trichococcus palustris]|uniref:Oadg fam: sodium pump decarboxylases gamma subunit n=2 Tax=Trichococcus palustris TaxID=140314 RepID=A0A143YNZ7_9LACT|nr:oadg fam: sodium pump decarboxylases gamma subunit [Trichococcus palustris]SFK83121.1 sodium pump decarboxylases, gamma subunit [Trichococcus palustris]
MKRMETFSLMDGMVVTVVAMVVVFVVLTCLWFMVELTHKLVGDPTEEKAMSDKKELQRTSATPNATVNIVVDEKRAKAAAVTALVMAYEEHPAKKFEIVEVVRVK